MSSTSPLESILRPRLAAGLLLLSGALGAPVPAFSDDGCDTCGPAKVGPAKVDWLTLPSTYTHDPERGTRVVQFTPTPTPTAAIDPTFVSSGYTHLRSTIAYGQSADNYHRVQTWGQPVRPYGEWRFPFRPFSTPYPNWGPPYAGLNLGFGFGFPGYPPAAQEPWSGGSTMQPGHHHPGHHGAGGGGRFGHPANHGVPGHGNIPDHWNGGRGHQPSPPAASPFNPYPAGPGSPYPVAPYYDGFYPTYRD